MSGAAARTGELKKNNNKKDENTGKRGRPCQKLKNINGRLL